MRDQRGASKVAMPQGKLSERKWAEELEVGLGNQKGAISF